MSTKHANLLRSIFHDPISARGVRQGLTFVNRRPRTGARRG